MFEIISKKLNFYRLKKKRDNAQNLLINAIKSDTRKYVPAKSLALSDSATITNKNTNLVYRKPYARYQYKGYVMTDERGRTFVERGAKKPIVTTRRLKYTKTIHPLATYEWFEESKKHNLNKWVQLVKDSFKNG